jgi:hypothetical protein
MKQMRERFDEYMEVIVSRPDFGGEIATLTL